jgi:hypothetical protein
LASERGIDVNNPNLDGDGYPLGYSKTIRQFYCRPFWRLIQVVTRQAFHWGFSSFPIPNWAVKYSGLMRYGLFKRNFKGSLCSIIIELLTQSINIDLILIMIKPLMG